MLQDEHNNYHILLDYDGVLMDFVGGVEREFNVDLSELDHWGMWDVIGITGQEFWEKIKNNPRFWADLKPYPWARDLLNMCLEKTKGNVTIATSPDLSITCASQKMYSIANNFPTMARKVLIGPEKHLLAKPQHILIDDSHNNYCKFLAHGGRAIEFPQLWNETKTKPDFGVVDYVAEQIDQLMIIDETADELKIKN